MLHVAPERVRFTERGSRGFRRVLFLRGLTTKDVAVHPELAVNAATVNQWLAGSLMVTLETLEGLAHAVGCADWASVVKMGEALEELAEPAAKGAP